MLLPAKFYLDRLRAVDLQPPKLEKFGILTKFIGFMRVLILHYSAKFGWFTLVNVKTINN